MRILQQCDSRIKSVGRMVLDCLSSLTPLPHLLPALVSDNGNILIPPSKNKSCNPVADELSMPNTAIYPKPGLEVSHSQGQLKQSEVFRWFRPKKSSKSTTVSKFPWAVSSI